MLNLQPVRLRWRENVSLRRFQNRNLLEMDHFRRHAVEDQLDRVLNGPYFQALSLRARIGAAQSGAGEPDRG
jgi:hypothetical protein